MSKLCSIAVACILAGGAIACGRGTREVTLSGGASSAPTTTPTTAPATQPITKDRAKELAAQFVRAHKLDWGDPEEVVEEKKVGFRVMFSTPRKEERALGPRTVIISETGEVRAAARR